MGFKPILSEEDERRLVVDAEDGWFVRELSVMYKVSIRTVYRILAKHDVSPATRKRRRKPVKRTKPLELKPCGTDAAYQRHRRKGEYPCTACLEAHAAVVKKFKNKRKKK